MKIAEIILNTEVRSLDRIYHYLTQDDIYLEKGMRVEVPFGYGNKSAIGYFWGYTNSSPFENLKFIKKVIDDKSLISPKGIELAKYVKKTTLCSMAEALSLLLPPAVNYKYEKIVLVTGEYDGKLTPLQTKVMETLKAAGGEAEQKKLLLACGIKSSSVISALAKIGAVSVVERPTLGTKEKIRKKVYLKVSREEIENFDKLGSSMKKALELLYEYESMFLTELISFSGCSRSSVQALEKKGFVEITDEVVFRSPINQTLQKAPELVPNTQQKYAIDTLKKSIDSGEFSRHLLFGVTGSGKTEVFLQAVSHCLEKGKNAVILVPEISLTPQMTRRFISRFGNQVAVLHSGLSLGERYDEWKRIKTGQVRVAVGARSAIFAPFENIGLIVIDEEHENTYKSEKSPRYDARDIAGFRAMQNKCPVIYASATPRVEDYYEAVNGKINLLSLSERANSALMPDISVVNMANELAEGNRSVYSRKALSELKKNIVSGQQSLVFLNRRGFSTFVSCRSCGYVVKCPNCSVSLTYHAKDNSLKCHMCGYSVKNPDVCPECSSKYIKYFGAGTQKAEEELKLNFEGATYLRMDADTTSHKFSHERILDKFSGENINVLLGTQMITKGLDFPGITLTIVLASDSLINMGDYRASERAFSQLVQVCGRAGRGENPGRALLQTYEPENKIFKFVINNDYIGFYEDEIKAREIMQYPPFSDIVSILVTGEDEQKTGEYGMTVQKKLESLIGDEPDICTAFFGLAPAQVFKIKNKYRYRIIIKTVRDKDIYTVLGLLSSWHVENKNQFGLEIDINPNSLI